MTISWLPDWTQELAYPAQRKNIDAWRWEFLRRNPRYQDDWERLMRPQYGADAVSRFREPRYVAVAPAPRGRLNDDRPEIYFPQKYGIGWPPPPPEMTDPPLDFEFVFAVDYERPPLSMVPADEPYSVRIELAPGDIAFVFNVTLPLTPQFERARKAVNQHADNLKIAGDGTMIERRNHLNKWPLYLRVLDAEASGASFNEMAVILFPEKTNVYPDYEGQRAAKNALSAARRLRDGDYRFMAI